MQIKQVNYLQDPNDQDIVIEESAWCNIPYNDPTDLNVRMAHYMVIASTCLFFIIPFAILFGLYTK